MNIEPVMSKTNNEGKDSMENKWVTEDQFIQSDSVSDPQPVIMIHGFVGSPFDYKPLADSLSGYNYDLIIPVVPGQVHTSPILDRGDFTDEFYIDWLDSIISETTKRYERKPYLIGFSMGGAISSCVADKDKIDKLVLIAPYYSLPVMNDMISDTAKGLKYILPAVPKFQKGKINDPEGYKRYEPGSDMISVKAFTQLQKLAERGFDRAKKLDMPVLILASENDQVASFDKIKKAADANPKITLVKYTKSNHIILYDYDRDDAIEKILEFLESNDNNLSE